MTTTPRPQIPPEQLQRLKDDHPCNVIAAQWVRLRRHGNHWIGRCPLCSGKTDKAGGTEFEVWGDHWVCAACDQGGDVIRLFMLRHGCDFLAAIDGLGGVREVDQAEAERRKAELEAEREKRDREANTYRQAERNALHRLWLESPRTIAGTSAEAYLALRGLKIPPTMRLRCVEQQPYYIPGKGRGSWRVIHTGPAMIAPLIGRDDKFAGLHFTYIDLARPKGKLQLIHPDDGSALPAKKVRGSKKGSRIVLCDAAGGAQMVLGEGIEKTAAVWMALAGVGRDLAHTTFWIAGDLGNIGGKSARPVTHPTLKTDKNVARRVPGPDPELEDVGIPIPDSVTDLVVLGDSTSDRFSTQCAMHRAQLRYAREGRAVRVAWAPEGKDFDDLLRGET